MARQKSSSSRRTSTDFYDRMDKINDLRESVEALRVALDAMSRRFEKRTGKTVEQVYAEWVAKGKPEFDERAIIEKFISQREKS